MIQDYPYHHESFAPGRQSPRVTAAIPECEERPSLVIEGVGEEVTSQALRRRLKSPSLEYVRVGTAELNLTHEYERGWRPALMLKQGARYVCEVYGCKSGANMKTEHLPADRSTDDGIIFYNLARSVRDAKDVADQRRTLRGVVAVWTDGLMVSCCEGSAGKLVVGKAYKVVVREVKASS